MGRPRRSASYHVVWHRKHCQSSGCAAAPRRLSMRATHVAPTHCAPLRLGAYRCGRHMCRPYPLCAAAPRRLSMRATHCRPYPLRCCASAAYRCGRHMCRPYPLCAAALRRLSMRATHVSPLPTALLCHRCLSSPHRLAAPSMPTIAASPGCAIDADHRRIAWQRCRGDTCRPRRISSHTPMRPRYPPIERCPTLDITPLHSFGHCAACPTSLYLLHIDQRRSPLYRL